MKTLTYKLFGHKWKYFFTGSIGDSERIDFRVCLRTNKVQYLITDPFTMYALNNGKPLWMNCVGYTDQGTKRHYSPELLK